MLQPTVEKWNVPRPAAQSASHVVDYLTDYAILFCAYLVATYLRQQLPFGKYVGTNYEWHHPALYVTIALGLATAYGIRIAAASTLDLAPGFLRFWTAALGTLAAAGFITWLIPLQSGLEKGYFVISALVLIALIVPWPTSQEDDSRANLLRDIHRMWRNRPLLMMWVRYNIRTRYAQALLGILWIVLLPLSTALVLSAVFSHIMRLQIPNVPFIAFFLSGFVAWGLFNQAISGSMRVMLGNLGLMNQIYFPRETLILTALGESLVDAGFMFVAMLAVNAVVGVYPTAYFLLLPLVLLAQIAFCLGAMFIVGYASIMIRDVPQLVTVLLQILFYLSPIIYPLGIVPGRYRFLITLNPMAALVEAYHSLIIYHTLPDWWDLIYPAVLGVAFLIFGYRTFKANEDRFVDMI